MIFQSEKSRKQLLNKNIVFTFRKVCPEQRKLGKDWATDKRGGEKIADIMVFSDGRFIKPIPKLLEPYLLFSGFDSVDDWIDEIKRLNKPDDLIGFTGEIYCVVN